MSNQKHIKEPKIQITKQSEVPMYKAVGVRVIAILTALVICGVVIFLLTDNNPIEVYVKMFQKAFGTSRRIWDTLQKLAVLLCISLAVTPAFKMKFWNIGAEGQTMVGGLAAAACMIYFGNTLHPAILFPLMVVCCVVAGMIWGLIPAIFKAHFNTNETLFTLMMNYVAMQIVSFCIVFWENPKDSNNVGVINSATMGGWLPSLFGQKYLLNILIVALVTVGMYIYLTYTKHGYEISVVGESENTARYIGINVKKVIIRTMAISGAICGIAGFILVSGTDHTINTDVVGGMGFTAIMVSWLAKFNPIYMILTSLLIVFLEQGADAFQLNKSIADILTGIILFFIIGCEFFIQYRVHFRAKNEEGMKL